MRPFYLPTTCGASTRPSLQRFLFYNIIYLLFFSSKFFNFIYLFAFIFSYLWCAFHPSIYASSVLIIYTPGIYNFYFFLFHLTMITKRYMLNHQKKKGSGLYYILAHLLLMRYVQYILYILYAIIFYIYICTYIYRHTVHYCNAPSVNKKEGVIGGKKGGI